MRIAGENIRTLLKASVGQRPITIAWGSPNVVWQEPVSRLPLRLSSVNTANDLSSLALANCKQDRQIGPQFCGDQNQSPSFLFNELKSILFRFV